MRRKSLKPRSARHRRVWRGTGARSPRHQAASPATPALRLGGSAGSIRGIDERAASPPQTLVPAPSSSASEALRLRPRRSGWRRAWQPGDATSTRGRSYDRGDIAAAEHSYAAARAAGAKSAAAVGIDRVQMARMVSRSTTGRECNTAIGVIAADLLRVTKASPAFGPRSSSSEGALLRGDAPGASTPSSAASSSCPTSRNALAARRGVARGPATPIRP